MSGRYEFLEVERRGRVGWIIFDRPDADNAANARMLDELELAWSELDADPEVRVIVNTGNGSPFHAGMGPEPAAADKITARHHQVRKPVIAAVNGVCAGDGLHFVADADIVIASSDATFLDLHVSVGQVSASETITLARKLPMEAILRMALVGRYECLTAERALELGMLSQVVEPDALRDVAQELAEKVALNSPTAMAHTKKALWGALEHGLTDACKAGVAELVAMWGHPDQVEGPRAFAERREPSWQPLA